MSTEGILYGAILTTKCTKCIREFFKCAI